MLNILFSPRWFSGGDILIDIFSIVVLLVISVVTFRYHQLNQGQKKHIYFSLATLFLALAFVFKIITNFTLYEHVYRTFSIGVFTLVYGGINFSDTLFLVGTLLYRLFTLLGFYLLFRIYCRRYSLYLDALMIYFMIIIMYFASHAYYIFHLTALLFLLPLVRHYIVNYRRTKDKAGQLIAWSFGLIAASQVASILLSIDQIVYVLEEGIQFIGYVLLLLTVLMVRFYGKKKK